MSEWFNVSPFNLPPSEGWVVIYLLMAGAVLLGTYWLCAAIGAATDRARTPALAEPWDAGPYRTPAAPGSGLAIGQIPHERDLWTVAYMRGGVTGVAQVLAGRALAENCLVMDGALLKRTDAQPSDPLVAELMHQLPAGTMEPATVREAARAIAAHHALELEQHALIAWREHARCIERRARG